ncbi:glycosyl hydrolase [Rhodococcus sp. IEGM 1409]|uniref:glycoside hydrolase family 26 protein n=1 Tax=Rhodococcus sp. IEGM 1409 TaxID=3047082 RepID=UPI0024B7AEB7|nr:glycosyl hydrolase [Rhodococcus sp. IEGM 1409]MDI9901126.1 glycosyl hydrolase [Rhodococcus sp. IEGM 1409]
MTAVLGVLLVGCAALVGFTVATSGPVESLRYGSAASLVHDGGDGDRVMFGAQIDWEDQSPDSYSAELGKSPYVYGKFLDFPLNAERRASLDSACEQVARHGGILFVTLQPYDGLSTVTDATAEQLTVDLTRWNKAGTPVIVRFAHEMNGSWYPWSQQPTTYVPAFRKIAEAVHAAPDSAIVWSPNDGGGYPFDGGKYQATAGSEDFEILDTNHDGTITEADDPYAPYYPGDDAVDWVGLSLYHFGPSYPWGQNEVPEPGKFVEKLTGNYSNMFFDQRDVPDFYSTYADGHDKPLAISQTAAVYNPANPDGESNFAIKQAWWSQVLSDEVHERFPRIKLVNWFEQHKVEADFSPAPIPWGVLDEFDTRVAFRRFLPSWLLFAP